jgi:hypothetical protein
MRALALVLAGASLATAVVALVLAVQPATDEHARDDLRAVRAAIAALRAADIRAAGRERLTFAAGEFVQATCGALRDQRKAIQRYAKEEPFDQGRQLVVGLLEICDYARVPAP